jgi:pimeloyl-ACP methyl ester carboxylesterase
MPFDEQRLLETPGGTALNLFVKKARQAAHAVVQINHGLSEHAGHYAAFANFLAERGFHVYAQDHRGHGGTKAEDALPGMFARKDGVKKVVADVASVHDLIATEHPGLPVILFGRSVGGLIALSFLCQRLRPVAGAAIWNYPKQPRLSSRAARLLLGWERFRLGSDAPSRLLPLFMADAVSRATAYGEISPTPIGFADHLSPTLVGERKDALPRGRSFLSPVERGSGGLRSKSEWGSTGDRLGAIKETFTADPSPGQVPTISLWSDVFAMMAELSKPGAFDCIDPDLPVHLVGDGGGSGTAFADRLRRKGFSNLVSGIYVENQCDCLNGPDGTKLMQDFTAWIDRGVLER